MAQTLANIHDGYCGRKQGERQPLSQQHDRPAFAQVFERSKTCLALVSVTVRDVFPVGLKKYGGVKFGLK